MASYKTNPASGRTKPAGFALDLKRASHASALLLAFTVAKSVLGLLLKRAVAGEFGAGMETDAYFAAFTIPQQLGDFVIGGIVFRVLIPVFQKRREAVGADNAAKDISGVLNFSTLILLLLTAFFYAAAPYTTPLIFGGFNSETTRMTVKLTRILSPAILLMGLALVYTGLHHAFKSFLFPAIATLIFPITSLAAIYILPENWGVERLAYGNLAGVALGVTVLLATLAKDFKWRWNWNLANPALTSTFAVAWPLLLANLTGKIIPFIQKYSASKLPEGSVSYLEYALFLSGAVMIFVVSPITTAIFPVMGEHKAKNNEKALLDTFHETVKVLAFLAIPSALFLGLEAKDIVAFLLGTGRFSPENAAACAGILAVVATMIVPQSINFAMGNLFLVHGKTKAISFANIALTLTAIPVYIVAAEKFGVLGIAATYAGHYTIAPLISIAILRVGHPGLISRSFIPPTLKFLAATAFSAMVTLKIQSLTENLPVWTRLCATGIGLAAVYWAATEILVIDTLAFIVARLKNEN